MNWPLAVLPKIIQNSVKESKYYAKPINFQQLSFYIKIKIKKKKKKTRGLWQNTRAPILSSEINRLSTEIKRY